MGRQGVEGAAFTCEETVLVSLGGSLTHQSVSVWDWRQAPDSPLASFPLKAGKLYTHLAGLLDYLSCTLLCSVHPNSRFARLFKMYRIV